MELTGGMHTSETLHGWDVRLGERVVGTISWTTDSNDFRLSMTDEYDHIPYRVWFETYSGAWFEAKRVIKESTQAS